ncbi:MAG TPA: ATP-binding protein [Pirellulales bacterium]|nr:ATP-binding protein [Pirellulales bacterium]
MSTRFILRMAAPMVGLSLLLLAVGVVAAWYVHSQQKENSDLLAGDVSSMLTAEDLEIQMREVRNRLNRYLRLHDRKYLDEIPALRAQTLDLLEQAKGLARNPKELELVAEVDRGCQHFFSHVDQLMERLQRGDAPSAVGTMIDDVMQAEIFAPAREYVEYLRRVVENSQEQSQRSANRMRLALLLLGVCGSVGGLLAGFGIARGVSRSIVQLSVPVHGVAGKLNEVIGPITLSAGEGFEELESALRDMADHVGTVVERLEQRELEVLRGEQLAAVGQLAAGIAHEVRNPLMAMKILVQAAVARDDGGGLRGRDLMVVDEEITRLEQSIQSLLDFARPPQLAKSTVDVRGLVSQTLDLVSARAERQRVAVHYEPPAQAVDVEADSGQIRQVLLNLLFNALDSVSVGGRIEVRTVANDVRAERPVLAFDDDREPAFRSLLSSHAAAGGPLKAADGWCSIHIADSGEGLPAELGDRIFEPFVSTKETGTGLGLPICRRIVEAHGGRIEAVNRKQGGAEFVVLLPRTGPTIARGGDSPRTITVPAAAAHLGIP